MAEQTEQISKTDFPKMTISECQMDTVRHIEKVRSFIRYFTDKLTTRAVEHDRLKLESPEVEIFAEQNAKLPTLTYGSPEYEQNLQVLKVALDHHYANYRHHPEHFKNGINDMNLIDIVEMVCDWKAASMRQNNGNLLTSIEKNAKKFGIDSQLRQILENTAALLDKIDEG